MLKRNHYIVDILFVLALFAVFAASALMLVLVGANVYKSTVDDMSSNYTVRTSSSYITEKLRHSNNSLPGVKVITIDEQDFIELTDDYDGQIYNTYLYCQDGFLRELLVKDSYDITDFDTNGGEKILPLASLVASEDVDGLFTIKLENIDGITETLYLSERCTKNE